MGLSRNKVAVSEGAAGSPPFYGERGHCQRKVDESPYSEIGPAERAGDKRFRVEHLQGEQVRKLLLFNSQGSEMIFEKREPMVMGV